MGATDLLPARPTPTLLGAGCLTASRVRADLRDHPRSPASERSPNLASIAASSADDAEKYSATYSSLTKNRFDKCSATTHPARSPPVKRDRPEADRPAPGQGAGPPLRVRILEILTERVASPNWLSDELDAGLSHVAYHTRALDKCGCLELVDTAQRRGATEHFYKACSELVHRRPRSGAGAAPLLGGVSGATLQSFMDKAVAALEAGTIDGREDTTSSWMPLRARRARLGRGGGDHGRGDRQGAGGPEREPPIRLGQARGAEDAISAIVGARQLRDRRGSRRAAVA